MGDSLVLRWCLRPLLSALPLPQRRSRALDLRVWASWDLALSVGWRPFVVRNVTCVLRTRRMVPSYSGSDSLRFALLRLCASCCFPSKCTRRRSSSPSLPPLGLRIRDWNPYCVLCPLPSFLLCAFLPTRPFSAFPPSLSSYRQRSLPAPVCVLFLFLEVFLLSLLSVAFPYLPIQAWTGLSLPTGP